MDLLPRTWTGAALGAVLSTGLLAQGLVPNGDFEQGTAGWTRIRFDDPRGRTGVAAADVTGAGSSQALFADFVSPTLRTHADWRSDPFLVPAGRWPVTFAVMWQKGTPVQVPDPANNWIEVHLLDPSGSQVFTGHVPIPQQSNLLERRTFAGEVVVPVPGTYRAMISMQHSELSQLGYRAWIDDLVVGDPGWHLVGDGCPGTGGRVPMITASGAPRIGMRSWSVSLSDAKASSTAFVAVGASTTWWFGIPLPFDAGGGCLLRVGILWTFAAPVSNTGDASYPVPLVPNPALRGVPLHAQWLVIDPGSGSPFGLTMTPLLSTAFE